jgi:hypothetical protein
LGIQWLAAKTLRLDFFYRLLLLEPIVKVRQQEVGRKLFFRVVHLEMNRHVDWCEKEIADVAERVSFMIRQRHSSPFCPIVYKI